MRKLKITYRFAYGMFQILDKLVGRKWGKKLTPRSRKYLYERIENHLKKGGKRKIIEVDRVSSITAAQLKKEYIDKSKPVVFEGGASDWECCKKWTLDYFKSLHGENEVTVVGNDTSEVDFEIIKLKDVINNLNSESKKYLRFYPLLSEHPEHIKDFDLEWLREAKGKWKTYEKFQMFIGGKGSKTPMHNAMACNLFIQVFGEKEWILYPPEMSAVIDPSPGKNFHRSAPFKTAKGTCNPFDSSFDPPYHLYNYTDAIRVHLKPGDIFYNPPHYWHAVLNPTDSIGIGYRWLSTSMSLKSAPLYTLIDLISAPFNPHIYKDWNLDYFQMLLRERGLHKRYLKQKKVKNETLS